VDLVLGLIESDIDGVIDTLLPIVGSRFAIGGSVRIWGWEDFLELAEFVEQEKISLQIVVLEGSTMCFEAHLSL
jgi:hypothetical protein